MALNCCEKIVQWIRKENNNAKDQSRLVIKKTIQVMSLYHKHDRLLMMS